MNIRRKLGYFISICCISGLCLLPVTTVAEARMQTVSANSQETPVSSDTVDVTELDADMSTVYSGKDGALDWSIDSDGVLTISGTGNYSGKVFTFGSETSSYTLTLPQWYEYRDKIKSAVVNVSGITSTDEMFYGCSSLTSLDLRGFDTSQVTSMGSMFSDCSSLTSLDLRGFDTSQVTYMGSMFYGCSSLMSLDVSRFDTSQVTSMGGMFSSCGSLTSLDLRGFDTSHVTDMSWMFYGCSSLTSLDLRGFDTSQVTSMGGMFYGCSSLTSLDLSGLDTSQVTYMWNMFSGCSSLTSLDLSGLDTSQVTSMWNMFSGCRGLTSLDLSSLDTSQVTSMGSMFYGCSSLTSLDLSGFDISQVTSMSSMFSDCSSLISLIAPPNINSDIYLPIADSYAWYDESGNRHSELEQGLGTKKKYIRRIMLVEDEMQIEMDKSYTYCGSEIEPAITITIKGVELEEGIDYAVHYQNNINAGEATLIISGEGDYAESVEIPFTIEVRQLGAGTSVLVPAEFIYTGQEIAPAATVTDGGISLKQGSDYTVSYQNNVNVGTAVVTITGKNNCSGIVQKKFVIKPCQLDNNLQITAADSYYTGNVIEPAVTVMRGKKKLELNTDYTVSYENNIEPGTATAVITGKGNYTGTARKSFLIKCHLNKSKFDTVSFNYKNGSLKLLTSKTYYNLYLDFTPVKYATEYEIELTDEKNKKLQVYREDCKNKDFISKTLKKQTRDVYGLRIRGSRGDDYGEWSDRYYVIKQPKATARNYKGNLQIKWQKLKGVTGYDIYMSTKKDSGYKKVASANAKTTLKTIKKFGKKKLKKGTYYYYVVAKKKVGKQTFKSQLNFKCNIKKK